MKIIRATQNRNLNTLTEKVYKQLRNEIVTGKIRGGSRLVESALAEALNVSRTPVREALHRLSVEGFLYSIPRSGYIVNEMSDYDIVDLFSTRLAIEKLAAGVAMDRITPVELEQMELNLKITEEKIRQGHTEDLTDLDIAFHGIIYKASRSKSLFQICQSLSDHSLKYRIALIHIPEFAEKTLKGHTEIFSAFIKKDKGKLEQALHRHLELAKEDILKMLEHTRHEMFFSTLSDL